MFMCTCSRCRCERMYVCESKVFCNLHTHASFFTFPPSASPVPYHSHHPWYSYSLSFLSRPIPLSFFFSRPPLSRSSPLLPYLCASVCVYALRTASQDDGEVRAALGTSSQWRGLRPRDVLATISQGSCINVSPHGLQVTPGKKIDRLISLP